jgi:glycosyltransferase involved in cell wall biosynthesis
VSDVGGKAPQRLVTIGLVTYGQERFVRDAVRSVLAQTYSPLQVVICDDASPDATFDILSEEVAAYRGDHDVLLQRNPQNLGIGNFNRVMDLAKGEFVVIAHGDDVSFPNRVRRMAEVWRRSGVSLVSSNVLFDNVEKDIRFALTPDVPMGSTALELAEHGWNEWLFGGALAWDRKVFDVWGPLDPEKSAVSTDWIIPFRAALLNGIGIMREPLLKASLHHQSKRKRYLGDNDDLVKRESHTANSLTQFLYMLEAVQTGVAKGLFPERPELTRTLVKSIVRCAGEWRVCRNQLLAQGRRAKWLPIEP